MLADVDADAIICRRRRLGVATGLWSTAEMLRDMDDANDDWLLRRLGGGVGAGHLPTKSLAGKSIERLSASVF